jgi:tetratricopeptide (TPR) repeat protein
MAAFRSAPATSQAPSRMRSNHARWLARLGAILGFVALGWLILWIRDEFAVRASARDARDLIAAGQFQSAGEPLERWLKARPKSPEARFLTARRAFGLERFELGFTELQAARTFGYPAGAIDRERAIVLSRLGLHAEAEPVLRKIFLAHMGDSTRDPEVDGALARCYLETFQLRAAEEVIKRWILDAPADAKAYYWKAEVERRKTDADQDALIADYEQALRLDPDHDKARLALADLYLKAHRSDDAAREYTIHLERHPDDVEACLGLGQIAVEQDREEEAIRLLDRAMKLAPMDFRPLVERGKLEIHRGRLAAALEFFDKGVQMDSTEPEVHYQRGLILTQLGRTEEAKQEQMETARLRKEKQELERLLKDLLKSPADVELQLKAARWLFERGHPEEGRRWAEKILSEHPQHMEASRLLADHYEKQGNRGLANFYRLQAGAR